jgi:hypothetical protein
MPPAFARVSGCQCIHCGHYSLCVKLIIDIEASNAVHKTRNSDDRTLFGWVTFVLIHLDDGRRAFSEVFIPYCY